MSKPASSFKDRIVDLRRVRASDLKPNPKNWRKHPARQRIALKGILEEIGYADALIARQVKGGLQLIDGHLRADLNPDQEVPVLVVDLTQKEADLLLATLDPLAGMAEASHAKLNALIEMLAPKSQAAADLLASIAPSLAGKDVDVIPAPPAKPTCKLGDVWLLGPHRLVVGDATDPKMIARALNGRGPALMVTDPPYGVSYDPSWRSAQKNKIANDNRADWEAVWRQVDAPVAYVWHGGLHAVEVAQGLERAGYRLRSQIIWVKTAAPMSRGHYRWKHEPAWEVEKVDEEEPEREGMPAVYVVKKGASASWQGGRKQSTVWELPSPIMAGGGTDHPTQKPTECFARPMRNHTAPGELVFDPFLGSGTAIVAAQMTGRICAGVELDPKWADVTIKRWSELSKSKAKREARS